MKHYFLSLAAMLTFVCVLTSCGGGGPIEISTSNAEVVGDIKEYVSIMPDQISKMTVDYGDHGQRFKIQIKLKLEKSVDVGEYGSIGGLYLELLDENGYPIDDELELGSKPLDGSASTKFEEFLKKDPGTVEAVAFNLDLSNKKLAKELESKYRKCTGVQLTSRGFTVRDGSSSSSNVYVDTDSYSSDNGYSSGSSSSRDWDELLTSYDRYADKLIACCKKVAAGDLSAMTEYSSLMQSAQDFSEKMENAQSEMSVEQWTRYMEITNKILQASAENMKH
jgi:predicted small lipoprotein YifL